MVAEKIVKEFEIVNRLGLHARAASKLVNLTTKFNSEVFLEKDGKEINAKSIMGILILAAAKGTFVKVTVEGSDAETAIEAIGDLIKDGFGED